MLAETARFLSREARPLIGVKQPVQVPNPAAATDWSVKVPAGEQWHILTFHSLFTPSATVGTRNMGIQLSVDNVLVATSRASQGVTAASPTDVSGFGWSPSTNLALTQGNIVFGLWDCWLPQGAAFGSLSFGLVDTDQFSQIALYVERYYLTDQQLEVVAEELQREALQEVRH